MIRLTPRQLDSKWDFVKKYMGKGNNATLSEVDPNSNISHKNVATLEGEFHKDVMVQVNRYILGQKIKEMFGKKAMKRYFRDLKEHIIYKNDETSLKPYCMAVSLAPFIQGGMHGIGGESKAPEHLASFCGSYINLMYALASQVAGAVADVSMLTYFHYFAKKDFGADYLTTHADFIRNYFQQIIYSLNMPSGSRSYQSIFYNTSIFDREYFTALFGDTLYPDGSKPDYDEVNALQKFFMDWFGAERRKAILTFPVLTAAYLSEGDHAKDTDFQEFLASQMEKGHSFFHYHSPTVDSLSSCCFDGSQEVLIRSPSSGICRLAFKELYDAKYSVFRDSGTIYHNGSWVKGKPVRLPGKPMYQITTANKKTMLVTEDHLHATLRGDVLSSELTTDDYILCNTRALAPVPTENAQLSYEEGMLIGIYLGDGSMDTKSGVEYGVRLSLNAEKYATTKCALETVSEKYKCAGGVHLGTPIHNMYPVSINSKEICAFIREYVFGDYAQEKRLSMKALSQSIAFREGILAGYYASDGGNANRIYTTSSELVKDIECLLTSMGYVSIIDVSDRTDEAVVIRGNTYKRNFPLYCIRWYTPGNKRSMKGIYVYRNNSVYFKIVSVTRLEEKPEYVYCFEMENDEEPYFTLPSGIITHNCRLRNAIDFNQFSYSLGGTGVMSGSVSVITLNVNKIIQKGIPLAQKVREVHQYLVAYKALMYDFQEAGLMPAYDEGYISLVKQYITVGLNGVVEAAEWCGFEISDNEPYKNFLKRLFGIISQENQGAISLYEPILGHKLLINTELIPAEGVGVKFAKWNKKAGIEAPRDCYNSYLYRVEDSSLDIFDKFAMHGGDVLKFLDGGSAVHLNLDEIPTKDTWIKVMNAAIKAGSSYWTWNVKSTYCEDCGYIDVNTLAACSKCGSTNISYLTRIIGYLKKISSFSQARQIEAEKRYYHKEQK